MWLENVGGGEGEATLVTSSDETGAVTLANTDCLQAARVVDAKAAGGPGEIQSGAVGIGDRGHQFWRATVFDVFGIENAPGTPGFGDVVIVPALVFEVQIGVATTGDGTVFACGSVVPGENERCENKKQQ